MQNSSRNYQMQWKEDKKVRISKSEKLSFEMVMERNYAIWWLNMFREWIPKNRNSNWKSTSASMILNPGNRHYIRGLDNILSLYTLKCLTKLENKMKCIRKVASIYWFICVAYSKVSIVIKTRGQHIQICFHICPE